MAKFGDTLKTKLNESHATYFDDLCDHMVWQNVTNVNAAATLVAAQSGTIILGVVGTEQAAGTGFNVYLPAPKRSLWFRFIFGAPSIANNSNAAITITATSDGATTAADIALGNVRGHGDDNGANVVAGVDILTFVHNKATAGDQAMYISDGTNWFVSAVYDADGSITLA
jgi:hypothetical protein